MNDGFQDDLFGYHAQTGSSLKSSPIKVGAKSRRKTALLEIDVVDEYRRANGVYELCKQMVTPPLPGKSYHILTGGHVDLLAHLQWLMLHWKKVRRVFISAWAIIAADILLCKRWLEEGTIGTLELLLGDIFPSKYKMEWAKLMEMYDAGVIRTIYMSTIHSKVLLVDAEDGTKIVVESSANCNMNPRIEQSVVTVSEKLFDFYDVYFHEVLNEEEARYVTRKANELNQVIDGDLSYSERAALVGED